MMARAIAKDGGGEVLVVGLSRRNVEDLQKGRPLFLRPETHPSLPDGIVILFGETEGDMADQFRAIADQFRAAADGSPSPGEMT